MNLKRKNGILVHGVVACTAVCLLGMMLILTRGMLSAERKRALAEFRAGEQETIRLALWRMDAAATAWIAEEAQKPVIPAGGKDAPKPEVLLRFEAREDGSLLADRQDRAAALGQVLKVLGPEMAWFPVFFEQMPDTPAAWSAPPVKTEKGQKADQRQSSVYQKLANTKELAFRERSVNRALDASQQQFEGNLSHQNAEPSAEWNLVRSGLPRPAWIEGELFLLRPLQWRRPDGTSVRSVQGSWLDAAKLKAGLLAEIADLFPAAELIPAAGADNAFGMTLAGFPWKFEAGIRTAEAAPEVSRVVWMPLIVGWGAALLAITAVWLLVGGLLRLSEKRASFVSAVTHELRTPLTTFQLYSGMLESGAVKQERHGDYFRTLRREAERLSHLVENVLAFSRIERGSARASSATIAAGELVRPMCERFAERLQEAGLRLDVDLEAEAWKLAVRADAAAVEHVLFNLIDNAAKYAAGSSPATVELSAEAVAGFLEVGVRDRGMGIPVHERKRVFRPFHKSSAVAAPERGSGVGLGLSLSRRLARAGGGNLKIRETVGGACFVLSLPLAK